MCASIFIYNFFGSICIISFMMRSCLLSSILFITVVTMVGCGSSSGGGDSGGGGDEPVLPDTAPKFSYSPYSYPNGVDQDLSALGIYNQTSDCDIVHVGWDFMPNWENYSANKVPIVAVVDGLVENVVLDDYNEFEGKRYAKFSVVLAVSAEVGVYYTIEPFVEYSGYDFSSYVLVEQGDEVQAGDIIAYLPKLDGYYQESYIHLDFKVGIGADRNAYVCPTQYFSESWRNENVSILETKIGSCPSLCCE